MILTIEQIKGIILNNPNKKLILAAQKASKKLRLHCYGEGLDNEISCIEGHEKENLLNIRKKYAKPNKDIMARLARPIDKVFTAKGGSLYFNLTEAGDKKARELNMNAKDGISIRKWVETVWKPHMIDDPNGMAFMEIGEPINGQPDTYPTYKSIFSVYDYLPTGSSLEYIVFHVDSKEKVKSGYEKEDKIYRVVDDAFDYWIKVDGETITILKEYTFPNFFGYVPAILNSDLLSSQVEGLRLSLFSDVIELADDFLLTGSIRNQNKIRMGFPKYWEHASDCNVCKGEGKVNGEDCAACKGTGKNIMINPGDTKLLPLPTKDEPGVAPDVAGFVDFPTAYFEFSTAELQQLENLMSLTLWGTETKQQPQGMAADKSGTVKTATQVIDDIQPKADRLFTISEMAEDRHKFILDSKIKIAIDSSYKGSSVNYGRRYMLEGPDEIWLRYSEARAKGSAISILDDLLMEYIETKYSGDPVGMNIQLKLLQVEPFVHMTVQQVQALNASFEDYNKKLYFSEWLATLNDAMLLSFSVDALKQQLADYVAAKELKEPKPKTILN